MKKAALVVPTFLVCVLLSACSPAEFRGQVDHVYKISHDARYAAGGQRLPWAVGQWVLLRVRETDREILMRVFSEGERGFRVLAITRKEGSAFWIEGLDVWPDEEERYAFLVDNVDAEHMSRASILKVKILQDDGEIREFEIGDDDGELPSEVRGLLARFREFTKSSELVGGSGRLRNPTVPAGTFERVYAVPVSVSTRSGSQSGYAFFAGCVPIVYYVKVFARTLSWVWYEDRYAAELVEFGTTGAESYFFKDAGAAEAPQAAEAPAPTGGDDT